MRSINIKSVLLFIAFMGGVASTYGHKSHIKTEGITLQELTVMMNRTGEDDGPFPPPFPPGMPRPTSDSIRFLPYF